MKKKITDQKLRGCYYTPDVVASFLTEWAIRSKTDRILEPSCGDGVFLKSAAERLCTLGADSQTTLANILGIEVEPEEVVKARSFPAHVVEEDFFQWFSNEKLHNRFDVILGNPPFIRYQNFPDQFRKTAFELLRGYGFQPNRLTNMWVPFVLLSSMTLRENGRLAMVIPAELLQVNYAGETREFLSKYFDSLTLVTFRTLLFEDAQEEIVLLLGERGSKHTGIRLIELEDINDLRNLSAPNIEAMPSRTIEHNSNKWTRYFLTKRQLDLLDGLNSDPRITQADDLYEVNVGLVSGENAFFVLSANQVETHALENCTVPLISRSEQVKGIILTHTDYKILADKQKRVYLFSPEKGQTIDDLPPSVQSYITYGEEQGFSQNYKCRIRTPWYCVPQSWAPDAFLIRQANRYPKMILNSAGTLVTDTLHKVRFRSNVDPVHVAGAFLNSYTFALAETVGRSYGGGVLTFEPSEMRTLRIPMNDAGLIDFKRVDKWERQGNIERILDHTDQILLRDGLGLTGSETSDLRDAWIKMSNRRLSRKKSRRRYHNC